MSSPLTVYKLMILYMLERAEEKISKARVSDFLLEKGYTNFLTLQQTFSELEESKLVVAHSMRNRTLLQITDEGRESYHYFEGDLADSIKQQIDGFLKENGTALRNEASLVAEYFRVTGGQYEAHLAVKEKGVSVVEISLSVPTEETARAVTENWEEKNVAIYQYLIENLL